MKMNYEIEFDSTDVERIVKDHATALLPALAGYHVDVRTNYYMGYKAVLVKDAEAEPAPEPAPLRIVATEGQEPL